MREFIVPSITVGPTCCAEAKSVKMLACFDYFRRGIHAVHDIRLQHAALNASMADRHVPP